MTASDFIIEHCPDGILSVSAKGVILSVNPAAEKILGWPKDGLVGKSLGVLIPKHERRRHSRLVRQFASNPCAYRQMSSWRKVEALRGDGRTIPVTVWLANENSAGETRTTVFLRDMSDLASKEHAVREAHQALEEQQQENRLLALVARYTTDSVIITDENGVAIWVNEATLRLSGYRREDLIGRKPGHVLQGPQTDPATVAAISRAIRACQPISCDILNYTKGGAPYWISLNITPIRDEQGRTVKFIAVERDITALKRHAEELAAAKQAAEKAELRLAEAIEAITEGFVIYDEHDRLVMANSAYRALRAEDQDILVPGVTFEEIVRTAVRRGHYDTQGQDPEEWIRNQIELRKAKENVETLVRFTDGRWMLRRERRTAQGEMIGIRSDITAFKQQEEALQKALREAEAADRAKSEFIANVSHELRTPINSILGFTQLMLAGELSEKQRARCEIVKASSYHLLELVNNILDLSKLNSNSVELVPAPFCLNELVSQTVLSLQPLADKKNLALSCEIRLPEETRVIGDAARIKQILINLIGNAIKFTQSGWVRVSVQEEGDRFRFDVADSGDGIPKDKIDFIFERFSQLEQHSARGQGTGLGLAITKRLVELMQGEIRVESEEGKGSVFSVSLPLARERQQLLAAGDETSVPGDGNRQEQQRKGKIVDILVAEDHPFNQVLISEVLDSIGCRVVIAENGQQALDALDKGDFDLVIMDNQMPVMTGIEAIKRIRARSDWKMRIPIIALTANAMRGVEKVYQDIGVDAFITKPLDVNTVIEEVKRLAAKGRKLREASCGKAAIPLENG